MKNNTLLFLVLASTILLIANSLTPKGSQSQHVLNLSFRTVKFIENSIFFTTNNGRYFGFINTDTRGQIQVIYQLNQNERIFDEFSMSDKLIIGNKNKSMIHFEPVKRTFQYDERLINEKFNELRAFKQANDKAYLITQNSILYYKENSDKKLVLEKELMSNEILNPGVTQFYYDLYFFPTKKFSDRVIVLTTAIFEKSEDETEDKLLSCFKWFQGQSQQVDGKCTIQNSIDIQDFRITGRWAYLRMPDETYVYDENLIMKTRWDQLPTQYIAGHAVTQDHLTYLFKTNELSYYRLIQNFQNDDVKMTANDNELFITKKSKRMIKLNKPEGAEVIGSWLLQLDESTFKTLIQFNTGALHCYKITRSEASTQINYLFRLSPQKNINNQTQSNTNDNTQQVQNDQL